MVQATLVAAIAVAVQFAPPMLQSAEESGRPALMIEIDGAIGPATARYVKEALTTASERRAGVVILRLNTPGGLATNMREIIADVLASSVPVIGYVAPSGAHAASAGTYILYATHIAAMASGTNLGAATLAQIGGPLPGLPGTAQTRTAAALHDIASERSSTIVFPLPTDLLTHLAPRPDGAK
jgi:membrane-bound serine protease (ClpP class)